MTCAQCEKDFNNDEVECHCNCCWAETCSKHNCEDCIAKEQERLNKLIIKRNNGRNVEFNNR